MAQTTYRFSSQIGSAGGIMDIAPYRIDTFTNEEETGTIQFGMGVVQGENVGSGIALPTSASTAAEFCGVTVNRRTTEYDLEGGLSLRKAASIGCMQWGNIYVRVADGIEPTYGETAYLVTDGDEAGYFTNVSGDTAIDVKARFIGGVDASANIAPIELFNESRA